MGKWKCENFKVKNKLFFFLHFPDFSSIRRGICTVSAQSSYFLFNFFLVFRFFPLQFHSVALLMHLCCFSCSFFLSLVSFSTFSHISSIHPRLHKRKDATCWAFSFTSISYIYSVMFTSLLLLLSSSSSLHSLSSYRLCHSKCRFSFPIRWFTFSSPIPRPAVFLVSL